MKLILGGAVVIACYMLGRLMASEKQEVLEVLNEIKGLILHLARRIESTNLPLGKIIDEYKSDTLKTLGFFDCFTKNGRVTASKGWQNAIGLLKLPNDALEILVSVGEGLGIVGRQKQLDELNKAYRELDIIHTALKTEYKKKVSYYGVLGGLFGTLAVIVVI